MFHVFKMAERDIEDSPVGVSSPTVLIIGAKLLRPHDLGVLDVERSARARPQSRPSTFCVFRLPGHKQLPDAILLNRISISFKVTISFIQH